MDIDTSVAEISIASKQLIAIARATNLGARLLFMDEPTTALTRKEINRLFKVVGELKKRGVATVFVSHKIDEIQEICSTITVLRNGEVVAEGPMKDFSAKSISKLSFTETLYSVILLLCIINQISGNIIINELMYNIYKILYLHIIKNIIYISIELHKKYQSLFRYLSIIIIYNISYEYILIFNIILQNIYNDKLYILLICGIIVNKNDIIMQLLLSYILMLINNIYNRYILNKYENNEMIDNYFTVGNTDEKCNYLNPIKNFNHKYIAINTN